MTKVNARRATVTELLSSAKDVRSSAQEGIRNNKRFYECLDAFKVRPRKYSRYLTNRRACSWNIFDF
jgi:hypothetical protein